MIKRIISFIQKDIVNALRDNMIIYIFIFPILLAVGFRMFLPSLENAVPTFAVESGVQKQVIEKLNEFGNIVLIDGYEILKERVEQSDDVTGIMQRDGRLMILAEGNESEEIIKITEAILDTAARQKTIADFNRQSLNRQSSTVKETAASFLMLFSIMIGGILIGFNMIEEKESGAIRGLSVSPLTFSEYILSRAFTCLCISIFLSVISSFILIGPSADYIKLIVGIVASIIFSVIQGRHCCWITGRKQLIFRQIALRLARRALYRRRMLIAFLP